MYHNYEHEFLDDLQEELNTVKLHVNEPANCIMNHHILNIIKNELHAESLSIDFENVSKIVCDLSPALFAYNENLYLHFDFLEYCKYVSTEDKSITLREIEFANKKGLIRLLNITNLLSEVQIIFTDEQIVDKFKFYDNNLVYKDGTKTIPILLYFY